mmetsp:Transcript_71290/g.204557  ORF Transcript_71290/g.204557 Transcript_71290/m.204557 type:complete len:378 (-) Transcript_71290:417-1550(-)
MSMDQSIKQPLATDRRFDVQIAEGFEQATDPGGEGPKGSAIAEKMDTITDWAVAVSTFPFLFLMIPQIITNFEKPEELGKLAWAGTASGGLGNLLLCSFFTGGGELKQAGIQAIGAFTNMIVVCQVFGYIKEDGTRGIPPVPLFALLVVSVIGLIMPGFRACGMLKRPFEVWVTATTVIGMSSLFFSITNQVVDTFKFEDDNLMIRGIASGVGLIVGLVLVALGRAGGAVGGTLATALFMFMPVPQLVGNLVEPAKYMAEFNVGFIYLGTLGNGLGMSRAIFARNWVWLAGAAWGCYAGGVLLSFTCIYGSHQFTPHKMSSLAEILLMVFVGLFIVYTLVVVKFDREAQQLKRAREARECVAGCSFSSGTNRNVVSP